MSRSIHLIIAVLVIINTASAQSGFYLKNGDRVVFYGDSITDQRLYTTFVETYAVTRFPNMHVSFVHSGWSGDRVTGGGGGPIERRLQRDVIAYQPTVMTIMLGMNDASYKAYDSNIFNAYSNGYAQIIKTLRSALPNLRLTLIQPSPFDDVTRPPTVEGGYNAVLLRYSQFIKELAERERLQAADLNASVVAALRKANETDAALAQKIIPDRVHPEAGGHLLMANALLKSWNAPPSVTAVEIVANTNRVVREENTKVSALTSDSNSVRWAQLDNALPLPLDMSNAALALAVRSSDVIQSLNQQPLKVSGLTAPRYTLRIDGEEAGVFTKEQLAEGVNLAVLPTPMIKQAQAVHALTLKHNNIHFARWRQVQVPLENQPSPAVQRAMKALDDVESELILQQRTTAQPLKRRYELISQGNSAS